MTTDKIGPDHYRLVDTIGPGGVTIETRKYAVIGETPHCYYVMPDWLAHHATADDNWSRVLVKRHRRRVLKQSYKRYCYPDIADALRSYKARKRWQLSHAKLAMARAEAGYAEAERLTSFGGLSETSFPHQCEGGEYVKCLNWSDY